MTKGICSIEDCGEFVAGRELCKSHYYKWRRRTDLTGPCSIEGCPAPAYVRGLCSNHYSAWFKYGDPLVRKSTHGMTPAERFWYFVTKTDTCWLWTGQLNESGYGRIVDSGTHRVFAHRFAYELLIGPIPDGLPLDHLCRVPSCVNPAHLEPVTTRTNVLRGVAPAAANAVKTHCIRGHPFDDVNTYRDSAGRHCLTCRSARKRHRGSQVKSRRATE